MEFNSYLLRKLMSIISPPGRESNFCQMIQSEIENYNLDIRQDALGNLIVHKKGTGKKIMLAAHLDQIGLIVTKVSNEGFLSFFNMGGLIPPSLIGQRMISGKKVEGVINTSTAKLDSLTLNDLYLDIGCSSKEEAEKKVHIGDAFVFKSDFYEDENIIMSSGMDDKIGCFILLELIKSSLDSPYDIYYVFTVQEEVGTRGAATSGYAIAPDIAIAIDITPAGDSPNIKYSNTAIGKGAAIKLMDPSLVAPEHMVNQLINAAEDAKISYQLEIMERGGTDSGAIHLLKTGIPCGVLSIPTRNAHTANEIVHKFDVVETIRLLKYILENKYF